MIRNKLNLLYILVPFLLNSCESLQDFAGLTKPDLENELIDETPELILPPDFNKVARSTGKRENFREQTNTNNIAFPNQYPQNFNTVQPQITNYIAPQLEVNSSPTPSDSLERFKENKKFTIGQWVYGQYVEGFKQGNLYYRPIYDKGYNFSRRYIPDQNVSSFLAPIQPNFGNFGNYENIQKNTNNPDFQNLDNLPIID